MPTHPSRRTLLKVSVAAAVLTGCPGADPARDPEAVPEDPTTFPRTPMAGDMTDSRVVFTMFVADAQQGPVTLQIWLDGDPSVLVEDRPVQPDADGFAKVRVDGLDAGTWYAYAWWSSRPWIGLDFRSLEAERPSCWIRELCTHCRCQAQERFCRCLIAESCTCEHPASCIG